MFFYCYDDYKICRAMKGDSLMEKSHHFEADKQTRSYFHTYQLVLKVLLGSALATILILAVLGFVLL